MYSGIVYNIMIGCPSDIQAEVEIVKRVLFNWNIKNADLHQVVLLPVHWTTSAYPSNGTHPQTLLNSQLVEKSDLLISIFGSKLGTPTENAPSGSVEEINEHIKAGKQVMVFFRQKNFNSRWEDQKALSEYKESIKRSNFWFEYEDVDAFEKVFTDKLDLFLNNNWLKDKSISKAKDNKGSNNYSRSDKLRKLFDLFRIQGFMPEPFDIVEYTNNQIKTVAKRDIEVLHYNIYLFHTYDYKAMEYRNKLDGIMAVLTNSHSTETKRNEAAEQLFDLDSKVQKLINSELRSVEIVGL